MNISDIKQHFGSIAKAAKAMGLQRQSVYRWSNGIPIARQIELEDRTKGVLKADRPWQLSA